MEWKAYFLRVDFKGHFDPMHHIDVFERNIQCSFHSCCQGISNIKIILEDNEFMHMTIR